MLASAETGLQPVRYPGKTRRYLCGGFWFDCSFFTACPWVVTLTALQKAGAFVCAHDYHAVRTVQAAQPLKFVAVSWLVVGMGNSMP